VNNILWLIRREIWENRSLWIAPLVIAGVILIAAAFGGIHVGDNDNIWVGTGDSGAETISPRDREQIRDAMASAGLEKKQLIYAITLSTFTAVQLFAMVIVLFFYLLDSLLAERKDRSILFWKSLPVSDTEVVLSKLLTAAVVVPLFVLLVSSVLQVLFALVWSVRFSGTILGDTLMAWDGATWMQLQASFLLFIVAALLWYLPLVAYLMVVSVWARRNAFLWAVLPPLSILAIEGLIMRSNQFGEFLGRRLGGVFEIMERALRDIHQDGAPTVSDVFECVTAVFRAPETWYGLLVAAGLIFGAIRIRRYRDDNG
jgi:ABC-2 type transport system permease protein